MSRTTASRTGSYDDYTGSGARSLSHRRQIARASGDNYA
jgi:hypothetical protein